LNKEQPVSFKFAENETVPVSVKRIAMEQSQRALERLKLTDRDVAIHDARVSFKKMRALLKLIRDGVSNSFYQQENIGYRDVGRHLSSVRDSAAMVESLDQLVEHFNDQLAPDAFASIRKSFVQMKRKRQSEKKKVISETVKIIKTAQPGIENWPIRDDDFLVLRQGLWRIYKQGRTGMRQAYDVQDTAHFHEWRKAVKSLFYQLRMLRPVWPDVVGELAREIKKLAGYLSHDHDLALLHEKVMDEENDAFDVQEKEVLVPLIIQRRSELQKMARPLGKRIYVEKPKAFIARIETYWNAWECEAKLKR
jgi:CHAD domain-containing protein